MEEIISTPEVIGTNEAALEVFDDLQIGNNTELEPIENVLSREIHDKVVKDIGLKCLPSDSPNEHKHSSNSPRDARDKEVMPKEPVSVTSRCSLLSPCLTNTEVQRTLSSTPCPSYSQSTSPSSTPTTSRPVTCLLDTFSLAAPPLIPSTDRLISCVSLHFQALPLSVEELEDDGPDMDRQELSVSGVNPESIFEDTNLGEPLETPTEGTDEEDSQKNIQNISKKSTIKEALRRPSSSNLLGVFSPVSSNTAMGREFADREIGMDEVSMSPAATAAIKVLYSPGADDVEIEDLFRSFAGKVKSSQNVLDKDTCGPDDKKTTNIFSLRLSSPQEEHSSGPDPISGDDEVEDRDACADSVFVEGSSSSDEINNEDVSLDVSEDLYVH